jgi:archaellum biogenesis ATPase FlaH
MSTRQNPDYGYAVQELYLQLMLSDSETFARCQSIFNYELFDKKLQAPAKFIYDYMVQYSCLPSFEIVNATTGSKLTPHEDRNTHYDWLLDDFETFIRHKSLHKAIMDSADFLDRGEYGPVEDLIKKAVQIGLIKDLGTDYFEDPKARLLRIKEQNGQMSTGWPSLDHILFGGFNRGELNILSAPSGGGKSLFLANLAINYVLQGMNVLYVSLELSEELISKRIDSMITQIPARDIFKQIDEVDMRVRVFGKKHGKLQIKYISSGKSTNDIRSYLRELEVKTNRKMDVVLVDYLDLLMPISAKISAENLFIKDKYISEELRNLAMEKNCCIISAAQINRQGSGESTFEHSHISGGLSKIQTADNVFGIFMSNTLREQGKYQLQLMKTRNSSGVGKSLELDYNVDTMRVEDNGSEAMSMTDRVMSSSESIMNSLQRTSTVENNIPTPKAQFESDKLKTLFNNFDDDDL